MKLKSTASDDVSSLIDKRLSRKADIAQIYERACVS